MLPLKLGCRSAVSGHRRPRHEQGRRDAEADHRVPSLLARLSLRRRRVAVPSRLHSSPMIPSTSAAVYICHRQRLRDPVPTRAGTSKPARTYKPAYLCLFRFFLSSSQSEQKWLNRCCLPCPGIRVHVLESSTWASGHGRRQQIHETNCLTSEALVPLASVL